MSDERERSAARQAVRPALAVADKHAASAVRWRQLAAHGDLRTDVARAKCLDIATGYDVLAERFRELAVLGMLDSGDLPS